MDFITIKDLEVFANHGVFKEENALGQKFIISVEMYLDASKAAKNDDLTKSIHYGEVSKLVYDYSKNHTFKLIETLAERLAEEILLFAKDIIKSVKVEVKKPWAPVGLPLDTVSVTVERGYHTAYIALGSNMGDSKALIKDAVRKLDESYGCSVIKASDLIVTKPYGGVEQDDFVNGMLELRTFLSPEDLLDKLHEIEAEANRVREVRWGPRTLDLDIVLYDKLVYESENLIIPHVDMENRAFVLQPLAELNPNLRHPVLNKTIKQLLDNLQ